MTRSRALAAAQGVLQLVLERITARIAVSELARKVQVEHLDGGAVEIPNGVAVAKFADAEPLPGWPGECARHGGTLGFLGRFTEPRKGFPILLDAFVALAPHRPGLRLLVAGPGDPDDLFERLPAELRDRITFLGLVSEEDKARMLRSVDVYVAPNTGGESFGMILTEAMAAGTAVVASDLDAFRRVLDGGRAGALFPTGDAGRPARPCWPSCSTTRRGGPRWPPAREQVVADYDWPVVAAPGAGGLRGGDRGHRRPGHRRERADRRRGLGPVRRVTPRYDAAACGGWSVVVVVAALIVDVPGLDRRPGRPAARPGGVGGPRARRPPAAPGRRRRGARRAALTASSCTRRPGSPWTPPRTSARRPRTT